MARNLTAALVVLVVWAAAAMVVLFVAAKGDVFWNLQVGFLLAGAVVTAAFVGTELVLARLGLDPPYRPG